MVPPGSGSAVDYPPHAVIERMRVNNTVQRASAHQTPDSVRPAPEDEARTIVQSRVLVSSGAVVSDLVNACFDTAADVSLIDINLARQLASSNNKLAVTPTAFAATAAVGGTSKPTNVSRITGLSFIDLHGNTRDVGVAYAIDLSHCSFDLLLGTPFPQGTRRCDQFP